MVAATGDNQEVGAPTAVSTIAGGDGKRFLEEGSCMWISDKFTMQTREESLLQVKGLSDRKDKIMRDSKIK